MFRFLHALLLPMFVLFGLSVLPRETVVAADPAPGKREQPRGSLVIIGGGATPQSVIARALELGGGPSAHIIVIPFAYSRNSTGNLWVKMWRQAGARNVAVLTWDHDPAAALREMRTADVVWFGGGDQNLLMAGLARLDLIDAIRERYRAGAVVAGTSAGAAVMSGVMMTGSRDPERAWGKGLGLWTGVIVDQHYLVRHRQPRLLAAVQGHPNLVGVGIDEATAVIVRSHGRRFEVVGRSKVEVLVRQPKGAEGSEVITYRLEAGKSFDLPQPR